MAITNNSQLYAYAQIAGSTYDQGVIPDVSVPGFGTYNQIAYTLDDPNGFQARAFFNTTTNELVIAFTGTETGGEGSGAAEIVPDLVADLSLAVTRTSTQDAQARSFIQQVADIAEGRYGPSLGMGPVDDHQRSGRAGTLVARQSRRTGQTWPAAIYQRIPQGETAGATGCAAAGAPVAASMPLAPSVGEAAADASVEGGGGGAGSDLPAPHALSVSEGSVGGEGTGAGAAFSGAELGAPVATAMVAGSQGAAVASGAVAAAIGAGCALPSPPLP